MKRERIDRRKIAKLNSEATILQVLIEEGRPLRWKEILEKTKLSTRTLSDRIKDLNAKGLVNRTVDHSEYPPAVSYGVSSSGKLATSDVGLQALHFRLLLDGLRENRVYFRHFLEEGDITGYVDMVIEDFIGEFLFTAKYVFEKPLLAPHLIEFYARLSAAKLESLFELWEKYPEVEKSVVKAWTELSEGRKRQQEERIDIYVQGFQNRDLASAIIKCYSADLIYGFKGSIQDYLEGIMGNKERLEKLEKELGASLTEARLQLLTQEKAWENLVITRKVVPTSSRAK